MNHTPMIGHPYLVGLMRSDVAALIETGARLPVFFASKTDLIRHFNAMGASINRIGRTRERSLVWVSRHVRNQVSFDLIYASASYHDFRKAYLSFAIQTNRLEADYRIRRTTNLSDLQPEDKKLFKEVDIDHVANRASLPNRSKNWVCLFPVESRLNSKYGSRFEAGRRIFGAPKVMYLTPKQTVKLFADAYPRSTAEKSCMLAGINGQFLFETPAQQSEFARSIRIAFSSRAKPF